MRSKEEISKYALSITGWMGPTEGLTLLKLATDKDVIEVGSMYGKSTAFMAPVAKTILCVDTFELSRSLMGPRNPHRLQVRIPEDDDIMPGDVTTLRGFLKHMEPFDNVTTVVGDSQTVGRVIADNCADLVFVDAGHTYKCVAADIKSWLPKLRPNGVIAFHDYPLKEGHGHLGVKKAVDEVFKGLIGQVGSVVWTNRTYMK